jgi:hypothetical protein
MHAYIHTYIHTHTERGVNSNEAFHVCTHLQCFHTFTLGTLQNDLSGFVRASVGIAVALGICVCVALEAGMEPIVHSYGASASASEVAASFLGIRALAAPAVLCVTGA